MLRIGEVAVRTELSVRTLRHYDELGVVSPSARTVGGFRLYTEDDVAHLMLVRRMKPLGFGLDEMRALVAASAGGAHEQVREFHTRAVQRCAELRTQLARAEEFVDRLAGVAPPGTVGPGGREDGASPVDEGVLAAQ